MFGWCCGFGCVFWRVDMENALGLGARLLLVGDEFFVYVLKTSILTLVRFLSE